MRYILLLLTLLVMATAPTQAQDDNPYARFGHKGKVLKTPQERQQFMLKIPNPDATSEIALVGIAPNEGKYYLFDAANEVIQEDTLVGDELSRFLSVDPLTRSYPWYTPYQFAGNSPLKFIDLDGLERGFRDITEAEAESVLDNYSSIEVQEDVEASSAFRGSGNLILSFSDLTTSALINDSKDGENYNWDFARVKTMQEAELLVNAYKTIYGELDNIAIADHGCSPYIGGDALDDKRHLSTISFGTERLNSNDIQEQEVTSPEFESFLVVATALKDGGRLVGFHCNACQYSDGFNLLNTLSYKIYEYRSYNGKAGILLNLNGDRSVVAHKINTKLLDAPLTLTSSYQYGFYEIESGSLTGRQLFSTLMLSRKDTPVSRSYPGEFNLETWEIEYDKNAKTTENKPSRY